MNRILTQLMLKLKTLIIIYGLFFILKQYLLFSFVLSPSKSSTPDYQLFKNATFLTRASPSMIITDNFDAYNQETALNFITSIILFLNDLNNNFIESFNKTFKA